MVGVQSGVTTVIDQGGPSCMTFPGFRKFIVEQAQTNVLAFLSAYVVGGLEGHYYPNLYGPDGVDVKAWEIALMTTGIALALLAESAALSVLWETRNVDYGGPAPAGRRHFFALAAAIGNVLFIVIIVLSGTGAIVHPPCMQS